METWDLRNTKWVNSRLGSDQHLMKEPLRALNRLLFLWVSCCALLLPNHAAAQPALSLRDAIQRAVSANPILTAAQDRIEEAKGQRVQAGLKPNPRLTLQSEDIRPSTDRLPFSFANSTEDYVTVSQTVEVAGKRTRRMNVADSALRSTELNRNLIRLQLEARVSAAYWTAAGAARNSALQEESLRTFDQDVLYTRNRVKEGVAAEADLMRIELERDRVRGAAILARSVGSQTLLGLYRAMGTTDFSPAVLTEPLETAERITMPDMEQVLQTRPELQASRQAIIGSQEDIRLQKADSKPDPQLYIGYKRNSGYDTAYGALQIDLPLRSRNQGNIASAVARLRTAQANLSGNEALVKAEIEASEAAYKDQQALLALLPGTLARAQEAERLARAAYREGGIDLLHVLDIERSRIQTQADYYRALVELRQSILNLQVAAGQDPLEGATP